jgi:F0F1-type ATP synthase membrane subunit b/b'
MSKFFQFTVFFGFFWVVGFLYAITNLLGRIHETQKQIREELAQIRANRT